MIESTPIWQSRGFFRLVAPVVAIAVTWAIRLGWLAWRKFRAEESRNWPHVQATIDITTGITRVVGPDSPENTYYVGVLTYFYRFPVVGTGSTSELRSGDYERGGVANDYGCFSSQAEAQAWADTYKGTMVTVRVNPKNPDDSVLVDADVSLAGAASSMALNNPALH